MSNTANYHLTGQVKVKPTSELDPNAVSQESAVMYMTFWMTAGTLAGGYLGWWQLAQAPGTFLPAVVLTSALTGAVVGASIGQLIGGMFHVIANKSLDQYEDLSGVK
jgi:hypothetical protein